MSGLKAKKNEGKVKQNVIRKGLTKAFDLLPSFICFF